LIDLHRVEFEAYSDMLGPLAGGHLSRILIFAEEEMHVTISGYCVFCGVYFLAVATPGPAIASVLSRSVSFGMRGAGTFIAGFVAGDLVWFTCTVLGLAALASRARLVFGMLRYVGVAYLLYLAFRLWTSSPQPLALEQPSLAERPWRRFAGSLSLTLGNPKPMVFFLALMPAIVRLDSLSLIDYLLLAVAIAVIMPGVLLSYAFAASRARRLFASSRSLRWLNRGASTGMAGAAVAIALE
jgi:threonine/homoserine/homoserine lactone efflux protein